MKKVLLKPKEGLKVPHPLSNRFLDPKGEKVSLVSYWARRLQDGDVEVVEKERPSAKKESPVKSKERNQKAEA